MVDGLTAGGAEILITHIIKSLGTQNYKHYVYFFASDGPVRERLESMNVPIIKGIKRGSIKNPFHFIYSFAYQVKDLIDIINRNRIDIIQSHMLTANQLAVFIGQLKNIPVFPTLHTPAIFINNSSFF